MDSFFIDYITPIKDINPLSDNIDVNVVVNNTKYFATFFTINNIITLMNNYKRSGECLNGDYFWSSNAIIVSRIDNDTISNCIDSMLKTGEFYNAFSLVTI